ncbi:MAG: phage tail tape measure protein, partial [Melioribacteraceae bacterium]
SVVDVLATTITNSAQDLQQLGNTMSYVAPVAASYGISLQMVAAATEVLANAGIKGSRSGTGLRRTLTALFSDSEKADTALGNLGVHVNTLAQDMDQEFLRVLRELNKATNGATTNVGELNTAVGIYAIPTFLNLVKAADESVTSLDALAKKYDDVSGAAFGMQKRMEAALSVDWEKALAAWSAIKTELFLLFGGDLREFVQGITAWIRGLADSKGVILETIDLLKELLKTVVLVTGAILGLSALKGAGNLLGAGIGAGKNLIGAIGQKAPALAATTLAVGVGAEAAAIKASTELTKDAVKQTGAWAASKKLLGVAMRAVPYVGTLLILKDIYDIYVNLTKITPKQAEAVTKLADAQQILNDTLKGFKILPKNEDKAVAAASAKQSLDETRASMQVLVDQAMAMEAQLVKVLNAATPDDEVARIRIQLLTDGLAKIGKAYNDLANTARAGDARLNAATRSLLESLKESLEEEALALERLRDVAKKELEAAQQRMKQPVYTGDLTSAEEELAKYKKRFEDLSATGKFLKGWDTFAEFLEEVNPGLARVSAELGKAEENLEAASKKSDRFSNSLKEQRYRLGQAAEGVEAYDASLDAVRQAAEYSNKIEGFFKDTAKAIEDVAEANRLENMTMEEKKQHFQGLITKYDDLFASTKELAAETSNLTIQMVLLENAKKMALADNSWTEGQEGTLLAVQERLATLSKNMQTLSEQKGARLEWGKELNGLKEEASATTGEIDRLTESTNDLRQSILELFNMDDADFPDTLSGNFEKLLKQSEALRTNIEKIRSGEIAVGKSSGGMYGGSGNVSGGTTLGGLSVVNPRVENYRDLINKHAARNGLAAELIAAVIQHESGGNPTIKGTSGEIGLMQLMEATAKRFGVTDRTNPDENIRGGAEYLKFLLRRFAGDVGAALTGYNQGEGTVDKVGGDISKLSKERQAYARDVGATYDRLRQDAKDVSAATGGISTGLAEVVKAANVTGQAIQGVDTSAQAATQSAKLWSEGLQLSAEEMGAAVEKLQAEWDAASRRQLTSGDADRYEEEMRKLMAARVQNRKDLDAALQEMNSGPITEQQQAVFGALTEEGKKLSQQYISMRNQAVPLYEELIKQGLDYGDSLEYNADQLNALAEGYDSVYTRSRKYNLVMVQIKKLEDEGYLTKTEAALERIDARFENLDPLTKDVATNIMEALKNVATGASTGKEAMDSLKESLVDIAMEKYVVKIGLDIVGQIMDPFLVAFQNIAMGMLSGLGDILASGI